MRTKFFSTKTVVSLAMLTAIGYVLSWLEFPIFPAASFLKLDFSMFVTVFGGYMFGIFGAVVIELIKQLLIYLTKTSTAGVGEIANFLVTISYVAPPCVIYRFRKGKASAVIGLLLGCVCEILVSLLCNRFINFPLFMGSVAEATFFRLFWYIFAFNAIKTITVSVLVFVLYKKLSVLLKTHFLSSNGTPPIKEKPDKGGKSADFFE